MSALGDLLAAPKLDADAILRALVGMKRADRMAHKALLAERWQALQKVPEAIKGKDAVANWKKGRGYELERLLLVLCGLEGLAPSLSYRRPGEQIDGLFRLDGRHVLFETKWTDQALPASEVFAFRGKLEGKLAGTLGAFVSMGGFSKDAPDALIWGKEINVVLVDREDVRLAFEGEHSWGAVMRVKLQAAAQRGLVFYNYQTYLDEQSLKK